MAELIPERVANLRAEKGLSQTALGAMVGTSQASIQRIESGEVSHPRKLLAIARALGTSPEYLTGVTDEANAGSGAGGGVVKGEVSSSGETVSIREIDLAYGMGGTFVDDLPITEKMLPFPRSWIRRFTQAPADKLFYADGVGDSMFPTLLDSDVLLIDSSQDTLRMADQIWAIVLNGVGAIKRLRPQGDGSVLVMSDNPQVSDDRAVDDEMFIIGRIVASTRKI